MRILIADDHDLLRDTLVAFFNSEGTISCATAGTLQGALDQISAEPAFDVVLLDYNMPGMNGLEGLRAITDLPDAPPVALMSGEASRDIAEQALKSGASGFIPKSLPAQSLVHAVKFMAMGEQYAPLDFMTSIAQPRPSPLADKLTKRELEMLEGLSQGKSNKEIARSLGVTEPTVKLHVKTLYRKIGVSNRTRAAIIAKESGLF